jgi:hypothetical protein
MVNFRVRSLDTMVAQLRAAGITVEIDPQSYPSFSSHARGMSGWKVCAAPVLAMARIAQALRPHLSVGVTRQSTITGAGSN